MEMRIGKDGKDELMRERIGKLMMYLGLGGFVVYGCAGAFWHNLYESYIVEINNAWDRYVLNGFVCAPLRAVGLVGGTATLDNDVEGGDDKYYS